jgi:DNA repair protein REV1
MSGLSTVPELFPVGPKSDQSHQSNPSRKRGLDDDWDNHGGYMVAKQRKLRNQFDGMGIGRKSNIFEGVSIYVNGWTQPTGEELKEMVYSHGGKYVYNFYSRSVVTHTIASNLPNSKILKLGSSIVCKPSWIVDSIAQNVRLPVDKYLLYQPQGGQTKLGFANAAAGSKSEGIAEMKSGSDDCGDSVSLNSSKGAEFVSEFFTHSRLHYLSTWSTELKQFTAEMLGKIAPKLPKLPDGASLKGLKTRAVVHIDLDCFFVSVSIRNQPHLKDKAVAVTHAKLPKDGSKNSYVSGMNSAESKGDRDSPTHNPLDSTSDIASCSYKARDAGVSNGMLVGTALKKCPDLILLPYDFKAYREVSQTFYEILVHYSAAVEAVSCDEAYLELTEYCRDFDHVSQVIQELRDEIQAKTGCAVSAGISQSMLLARMSTRVAKPDGQFYLSAKESVGFITSQRVRDLPGVGYSMASKLKEMGIEKCTELQSLSLEKLQAQFGAKTGRTLHAYARGVDTRELKTSAERKSVSVDINFGIRLKNFTEAEVLLGSISQELQTRAEQARAFGSQLTLKLKIRKQDAPIEPMKFLGHGSCDNVSRSLALLQPSRSSTECGRFAVKLLKQLDPVVTDIRGVGLQLSKLVSEGSGGVAKGSAIDIRDMLKGNMETGPSRTR